MDHSAEWFTGVRIRRLLYALEWLGAGPVEVTRAEVQRLVWRMFGGPFDDTQALLTVLVKLKLARQDGDALKLTKAGAVVASLQIDSRARALGLTLIQAGRFHDQARLLLEIGSLDSSGDFRCQTRLAQTSAPQLVGVLQFWSEVRLRPELFIPATLVSELNTIVALLPLKPRTPKWVADQKAVGDRAELYTVQFERSRTVPSLISWVARDSDSLGFDVEDRSSSPTRCIEVKGSRDTELMFFLSETELEKANEIGPRYELQFWGGIDLSVDPSTEYALLRAKGYPKRIEHLSIRLRSMEMQPVRWRVSSSSSSNMAVWVFGYGSLIWNAGSVSPVERRTGTLKGWHRTWTWISKRRHGAPTCALQESGEVKGILLRLNEKTQADDLEYFRSRERRVTEQMVANFPEPDAVTYFWTIGSNLADHPEFSALTEDELHAALAQRAKAVMKPGPDGVLASEYIKRVHSFDPGDPITAAIVRYF
jgi:ChaC-like protein/Domain of unknown function (DUF3883)